MYEKRKLFNNFPTFHQQTFNKNIYLLLGVILDAGIR